MPPARVRRRASRRATWTGGPRRSCRWPTTATAIPRDAPPRTCAPRAGPRLQPGRCTSTGSPRRWRRTRTASSRRSASRRGSKVTAPRGRLRPRRPRRPTARSGCCSSPADNDNFLRPDPSSATRPTPASRSASWTWPTTPVPARVAPGRRRTVIQQPADRRGVVRTARSRSGCGRTTTGPTRSSSTGAWRPAALFTLLDPGDTRIIVRLHSYEAFTRWPHLVDFSRVDDLVFVSDHLRDLSTALLPPAARRPTRRGCTSSTTRWTCARSPAAEARRRPVQPRPGRHQPVAKDPRWAVEVLRALREHDDRYRLPLVGSDMNPDTSHAAALPGSLRARTWPSWSRSARSAGTGRPTTFPPRSPRSASSSAPRCGRASTAV